ncbi:MAG TPA: hypothetical protein PKX44_08380, partial [Methanomassiliicoccaceae archaeon]|nr:hypothetical protein [Methanomassiliicoccaceae archaeon]
PAAVGQGLVLGVTHQRFGHTLPARTGVHHDLHHVGAVAAVGHAGERQLGAAEPLAYILPLTHTSLLIRDMSLGLLGPIDGLAMIYVIIMTIAATYLAVRMMKKRLTK